MKRLAPILALLVAGCARDDAGDAPDAPGGFDAPPAACAAATYDGTPTAWTLPASAAPGTFRRAAREDADCAAGLAATRLFDLTGDDLPDLVALTDCDDANVGQTRWRVWPAGDGGFGDEIAWTLPAGYGPGAFADTVRTATGCGLGDDLPAFLLADFDGDGAIDVAITASCDDPTLAEGAWRVHRNTGAGFEEEGTVREIGGGYTVNTFAAPRDTLECNTWVDAPAWALRDLDGDSAVDLVLTADCDEPQVGTTHWQVRRGGAGGFEAPVAWTIPPAVSATAFEDTVNRCPGSPAHFVADLEGDALPELVTPLACDATGSAWSVYPNEGDRHATTPESRQGPLFLNLNVGAAEQREVDCDASTLAWAIADDDADGWADITVTADCGGAVGVTRWDRWRGGPGGWTERVPLALPAGYSPGSFQGSVGDAPGCGGAANRPAWTRVDLDGDGVVEIVVTEACDDADVGVASWRVHPLGCEE